MPQKQLEFDIASLDDCNFDHTNPFDLDDPILDSIENLQQHKKLFLTLAYKEWLHYEYSGESFVVVAYQYILDNIRADKYQNYLQGFTDEQYRSLFKYLETTIAEEIKHSYYWGILGKKIYKDKFNLIKLDDDLFIKTVHDFVDSNGLITALTCFFMGETVTLGACSMLYRYSSNEIKKNFLKVFLSEEVKHINGFSNLMKIMAKNSSQHELTQAKSIYPGFYGQNFNYFGINQVAQVASLNLNVDKTKKEIEHLLVQSIVNNKWQKQFNEFVLKKNFNFYKNFDNNISEKNFNSMMNSELLKNLL
jgi:hypothetical protein